MAQDRLSQLPLAAHPQGTLIDVKVVPGASRDRVAGVLGSRLKLTVSRPAEKGAANRAAGELLARTLGLKPRDVELVAGPTAPEKTFLVRDLRPDEVRRRLGSE